MAAVGRPPIYDGNKPEDITSVEQLCESYFETLTKAPTVTGLTLYLGFADKSTLYDYSKNTEFSHSIKRALTKIEQYHEEAVAVGDKCTGNIIVLKNFNWKDTQGHDLTTNGKDIQQQPTIVFKKYETDGD